MDSSQNSPNYDHEFDFNNDGFIDTDEKSFQDLAGELSDNTSDVDSLQNKSGYDSTFDFDLDGQISAEEQSFIDFADHNQETAASQSDAQAIENDAQSGGGEYEPDSIVGFTEDGTPITAAEAGLVLDADTGSWDAGDTQAAVNAGLSLYNLYNAIDGGDTLSIVNAGINSIVSVNGLMDSLDGVAGDGLGGFIDAELGQTLGSVTSAIGLYLALDSGDAAGAVASGLQLANSLGANLPGPLAYAGAVMSLVDGNVEGAAISGASAYLTTLGPYGWAAAGVNYQMEASNDSEFGAYQIVA